MSAALIDALRGTYELRAYLVSRPSERTAAAFRRPVGAYFEPAPDAL